jgi:hypothetical protein
MYQSDHSFTHGHEMEICSSEYLWQVIEGLVWEAEDVGRSIEQRLLDDLFPLATPNEAKYHIGASAQKTRCAHNGIEWVSHAMIAAVHEDESVF